MWTISSLKKELLIVTAASLLFHHLHTINALATTSTSTLSTPPSTSSAKQLLKGKHKWLGGAVHKTADQLSIYGIPSNTNYILRIVPDYINNNSSNNKDDKQQHDHIIEFISADNNEKVQFIQVPKLKNYRNRRYKWLRGVIAKDKLFGIPAWADELLTMDLNTMLPELVPLPVDDDNHIHHNNNKNKERIIYYGNSVVDKTRWTYHGAALSESANAIYCIPSNADRVMKINVDTCETSYIGPRFHGQNKWYGGILGDDGCVYGMPYTAPSILQIDTISDEVRTIGDFGCGEWKWHGGLKSPRNGAIYAFPSHHDCVLKIDTNPDVSTPGKVTLIPIPPTFDGVTKYKWLGGAMGSDGNIYGMPCDTNSVLYINTENDEVTLISNQHLSSEKNKWQGGVTTQGGIIHAVPANAPSILRIDTQSFDNDGNPQIDFINGLSPVAKKWQGGFVASNGSIIYGIPEDFDRILKVFTADQNHDHGDDYFNLAENDPYVQIF